MPNLRLIHDNATDRATSIAASTTAGTLVAANMQTDRKGQVHRSTGTSVQYTLTWAAGESIGAIALPATNLTAAATVRVRLYSDTGCTVQMADSTAIYACPGLNLDMWDWTQPLNANAFAYGGASKSAVWFADHYFAKGCKIDLADAGNAAGYIDCARIVAGAWWSPAFNHKYGSQVSRVDRSVNTRTDAGDNIGDRSDQYDKASFDLQYMPEADRARLMQIMRNAGVSRNIFFSLLPAAASSVAEQDNMIYGKRANSAVSNDMYQAYSNKLEVEGW